MHRAALGGVPSRTHQLHGRERHGRVYSGQGLLLWSRHRRGRHCRTSRGSSGGTGQAGWAAAVRLRAWSMRTNVAGKRSLALEAVRGPRWSAAFLGWLLLL